ncbi:MAG TPA: tryptophan synthase subunit alpha [Candidatus Polarisedimenticolaceae bacterium]|nr:tryptophan synthase subunit alpha [Candidatus Polarisedimenticolaceae bacterium]
MTAGALRIEAALREVSGRPALAAFLTAGYPGRESFRRHLDEVAGVADVVEIGVPFTDPMADGVTIQRASRAALEAGVTIASILEAVRGATVPILLMSYLNPLLAHGVDRLDGIDGVIVPDLPREERDLLAGPLAERGIALISFVSPATDPERAAAIAAEAEGFVYAVAINGTTGRGDADLSGARGYLARVRAAARCPVLAGFGVRTREDVHAVAPPADGVVVGSALIEAIERGDEPAAFLRGVLA